MDVKSYSEKNLITQPIFNRFPSLTYDLTRFDNAQISVHVTDFEKRIIKNLENVNVRS